MNDANFNNDKRDINSYVNSTDLINYLSFLNFKHQYIFKMSDVTSLHQLFPEDNYVAIILLNDQDPSGIGHFICLRHDDAGKYTYFDCLGKPPPAEITALFENESGKIKLEYLTKPLMSKMNNICGKYCISFILAGNIEVTKYSGILSASSQSADYIVNNLYRWNYNGDVL